jgi:hypothetical protein
MPMIIGFTAIQIFFIPTGDIVLFCFQLPMCSSSNKWWRKRSFPIITTCHAPANHDSVSDNIAHTASLRTMDTMLYAIFLWLFLEQSTDGKKDGKDGAEMPSGKRMIAAICSYFML